MKKVTTILAVLIGLAAYGQECNYRTNDVDDFTGATKVVMKSEVVVTHTDSVLKKYYKRKDYLTASVYAGKLNDTRFIYFKVKILSKKAYDYYGALRSGSDIMLKTDSSLVTLKIQDTDTGDTDYNGGYTTYSVYCIIKDEDREVLLNEKVNKIRVYWSKGYEDYVTKDSSVIQNQLKCVK